MWAWQTSRWVSLESNLISKSFLLVHSFGRSHEALDFVCANEWTRANVLVFSFWRLQVSSIDVIFYWGLHVWAHLVCRTISVQCCQCSVQFGRRPWTRLDRSLCLASWWSALERSRAKWLTGCASCSTDDPGHRIASPSGECSLAPCRRWLPGWRHRDLHPGDPRTRRLPPLS